MSDHDEYLKLQTKYAEALDRLEQDSDIAALAAINLQKEWRALPLELKRFLPMNNIIQDHIAMKKSIIRIKRKLKQTFAELGETSESSKVKPNA